MHDDAARAGPTDRLGRRRGRKGEGEMHILRIFNNNVVLVNTGTAQNPQAAVVIGRGLAFGRKRGDELDESKIDQIFTPEHAGGPEQVNQLLAEIPAEVLALATELEADAREELGTAISSSFILPLADHLNFAIRRARDGVDVSYPLAIEVAQLYPKETAFGRRAVQLVRERLGVDVPDGEAIPIALHVVNAQFAAEDLARTFRMTEVFAQIFRVISSAYGQPVDQDSMAVARFVTHLRYLFVRTETARTPVGGDPTLPAVRQAVSTGFPRAFDCARKIMVLLEMQLGKGLSEDEHTYLTIHVARLAAELWGEDSTD